MIDLITEIPGFRYISKKSGKSGLGGSHGLGMLIGQCISSHVQHIDDEDLSDHILWARVSGDTLGYDFVIGSVYLPCEGSAHYYHELFDDISNDIWKMLVEYKLPVILTGDFNARTGNLDDFASYDEVVANECGLDVESDLMFDQKEDFEKNGINVLRSNADSFINNNGKKLIELCRLFNVKIANGRLGKDAGVGEYTCQTARGQSTIDYAILSSELFPLIKDFEVDDFDRCLSDAHRPIKLTLVRPSSEVNARGVVREEDRVEHGIVCDGDDRRLLRLKVAWKADMKSEYSKAFDESELHELGELLDEAEAKIADKRGLEQREMDGIARVANKTLIEPAKRLGIAKVIKTSSFSLGRKSPHKASNKPWFNAECRAKRKEYMSFKRKLKGSKTPEALLERKRSEKEYRIFIRKTSRVYYSRLHSSLRSMNSKDPREYWRMINSSLGTGAHSTPIKSERFLEHFRGMARGSDETSLIEEDESIEVQPDEFDDRAFNDVFTEDEISAAIAKLKSNKAAGADYIINEFLRNCPRSLKGMLTRWFNLILVSGVVPEDWGIGIIQPIYKKKGSPCDPDNYRGITLLSCVSKLFTSVINNRLNEYVESNRILGHEQVGFRRGYSTMDHIFTLHCIIVYYLNKRKRVYAAFLDYKKAFDLVDRRALWIKLVHNGIGGKLLNVVRNLYSQAKSCVRGMDGESEFFVSEIGVRQGENLSPLLFAMYLNDFKGWVDGVSSGLTDISTTIGSSASGQSDLDTLFKMSVLMYADDTLLLSDSANGLQAALNATSEYCHRWGLVVNPAKSKVMVFSRGKIRNPPRLYLEGTELAVSPEFTYLGVCMNYNSSLKKAISQQVQHADRALYALRAKMWCLELPFDIRMHLFSHVISPILLYGSEVWAFEDLRQLDTYHRKFLKEQMGLRKSTPSCMIYGETGQEMLSAAAERRMLIFWYGIAGSGSGSKLSGILYRGMRRLHNEQSLSFKWLEAVRDSLQRYGFGGLWEAQASLNNPLWFKEAIKRRMQDISIQNWHAEVWAGKLCVNYRLTRNTPGLNKAVAKLNNQDRKLFFRFRCANFPLPIYPHLRTPAFTITNDFSDVCHLCGRERGDEFHYLLVCNKLHCYRSNLISKRFWRHPNVILFEQLINSEKYSVVKNIVIFIKILLSNL